MYNLDWIPSYPSLSTTRSVLCGRLLRSRGDAWRLRLAPEQVLGLSDMFCCPVDFPPRFSWEHVWFVLSLLVLLLKCFSHSFFKFRTQGSECGGVKQNQWDRVDKFLNLFFHQDDPQQIVGVQKKGLQRFQAWTSNTCSWFFGWGLQFELTNLVVQPWPLPPGKLGCWTALSKGSMPMGPPRRATS